LWKTSEVVSLGQFLNKESTIVFKATSLPKEQGYRNALTAGIEELDSIPMKLKVRVFDYTKNLKYLNRYKFQGKITRRKYHGRWFYNLWIKKDTHLEEIPLGLWDTLAKKTSNYILNTFKKNYSYKTYRFLGAVFLGRRELLSDEKEYFSLAGVSHLLAISGLHIGLTSLILFFILRLFHIKFRMSLFISLIFLWFYAFLSGFFLSVLRATIMYTVFALSFVAQRKTNSFNSLGLAGLILLLVNPQSLFNIGFQLSFLSVFSIIFGFKLFKLKQSKNVIINYIKHIVICSLWVTLFITPVVSYYFGKVYILNVIYNVFLIPIFTLILGLNFIVIIFSFFNFIVWPLGIVISYLVSFFIRCIEVLGLFKLSYLSYSFSLPEMYTYYGFLFILMTFLVIKRSLSLVEVKPQPTDLIN